MVVLASLLWGYFKCEQPLHKRASAIPGFHLERDRQEMGCGKRPYFAQVLIARLAAIFDDSICESLPHFLGALFWGLTIPWGHVIWGLFWARLEFSSNQQKVIVWLMLLILRNKDLCDHMEKVIELLLVRLNCNSVICCLTINQLKVFTEATNRALPKHTADIEFPVTSQKRFYY